MLALLRRDQQIEPPLELTVLPRSLDALLHLQEIDIQIDERDIRVDVYRATGRMLNSPCPARCDTLALLVQVQQGQQL